jgi:hypothetical protein
MNTFVHRFVTPFFIEHTEQIALVTTKGGRPMNTVTHTTLLDLVQAVSKYARTDAEVVATVATLINSGKVRLCGNFAGARIDLNATEENIAASWPILQKAA